MTDVNIGFFGDVRLEKRALFSDLIDGVPASALGRLDLDSLIRAAAPSF